MVEKYRLEYPTLVLGVLIYACFAGLTYFFNALPLALALPAAAFLVAWQSSLQHEASHGHPSPWPLFNSIFAGLSLWLYLPFPLYRDGHMAHHASEHLTSPTRDSESYFFAASQWRRFGPLRRAFWTAHNTLLGRFLLGPLVVLARVYPSELRALVTGDRKHIRAWLIHGIVVSGLLCWTTLVCKIAVWEYLLYFVYPGMALSLLRSFAEHSPGPTQGQRIAIVETNPILSMLFLNNNLHVLHHASPGLPWYRYQKYYARDRDALLRENGGLLYRGYGELARRYLLRPIASPMHPREHI